MQTLFEKARIFEEEFLIKYLDLGIDKVIIEEPLVRSNNVNTVATLLRFKLYLTESGALHVATRLSPSAEYKG